MIGDPHETPPRPEAFRSDEAADLGLSRDQLRGKRFDSPFYGVHTAGVLTELADRCRAATLILPDDTAFSDETAAVLMMLPVPRQPEVVHVTVRVGTCVPRRRGIVGHVRQLRAEDFAVVSGLSVITAACTFVHLAAVFTRAALVGLGDAILRAGLATTAELVSAVAANSGRRGCVRARELISMLDPRAESVMESMLRLLLLDAGLPTPEVNVNVYDSFGQFLARADLLYRAAKVIIEYDGDHHRLDRAQFARDVRRGSDLAACGYLVLRFTASDLLGRPYAVVSAVRSALAQRSTNLP
jgi:very-short-patch-repair endonuclease